MEIKLKPNSTKEKAKKYKVDLSDIDKKIEFISKYMEEVGEEIDGTTVFEDIPIGLMVNKIRSDVLIGKRKYNAVTIDRLRELGILEYKIIGIKTKLDRLEKFCRENPALWRNRKKIHRDYLRYRAIKNSGECILLEDYMSKSYETKGIRVTLDFQGPLEETLEELENVLVDYVYIINRKSKGKLKTEYSDRLKEVGVGGPLGYVKEIEELSIGTGINIDKLDEIVVEYGSLDNFRKIYIDLLMNNQNWSVEYFESQERYDTFMRIFNGLAKNGNIVSIFDLDEPTFIANKALCYISHLLEEKYVGGIFLDKNLLQQAIKSLPPAEKKVLEMLYESQGELTLDEIAASFNLSREGTRKIRNNAIYALNTFQRVKIWRGEYNEDKRKEFIRKYFAGRDIFITDDSYVMNKEVRDELLQIIGTPIEVDNTGRTFSIAELELSNRAYNFLQKNGYNTVQDLTQNIRGIGDLVMMKNSGVKSIGEIVDKIHSLGFKFDFEKDLDNIDVSTTSDKLKKEIRRLKATYKMLHIVMERCEEVKAEVKERLAETDLQLSKMKAGVSDLYKTAIKDEFDEI